MPLDGSLGGWPRVDVRRGWRARISAWRETRAARRHLADFLRLDPRFARDVGLNPDDVAREIGRPFWEPIGRVRR